MKILALILPILVATCLGAPLNYYPEQYQAKAPSYVAVETPVEPVVQQSVQDQPEEGVHVEEPEVVVHTQYHAQDSLGQYSYGYASSDGSSKAEARNEEGRVAGKFAYTDPDGKRIVLKYVADRDGFRAEGDHLPVAPELPDYLEDAYEQARVALAAAKNKAKLRAEKAEADGQVLYDQEGGDNGGLNEEESQAVYDNEGGSNGGDEEGGDNGGDEEGNKGNGEQEEGGDNGGDQEGGDNGGDQEGGDNGGDQEGGDNGGDQEGGDNGGDQEGGDNGGDEEGKGEEGGEGGGHEGDEGQEGGDEGNEGNEEGEKGKQEEEGNEGEGEKGKQEEEEEEGGDNGGDEGKGGNEEGDEEGNEEEEEEEEEESGEQEIYRAVYKHHQPQQIYFYTQPQQSSQYETYEQAVPQNVPAQPSNTYIYVPYSSAKSASANQAYQ